MGRRLCFWTIGALLAASGCGVDEAVGVSSAGHALDPAFDPVTAAYCESLFRCDWPDAALLEFRILSGTPEGCRTLVYRKRYSASNRDLDQAITEGRVRIVPPNVDACVEAIGACRPYALNASSPCGALLEGTLPEGETCRRSEECAGDAYCRSDTLRCPGVCTAHTAAGGRCKSSQECGAPANALPLCVSSTTAPRSICAHVPILEPARHGEGCALTSSGSPLVPCEPGLWCDHDFGAAEGVCRRPIALGEACAERDVCAGEAFCQGSPGVCRPARVTRAAGGPCDPEALVWCDALQNLSCVGGTCQVLGDGALGSACAASELYAAVCREGSNCQAALGEELGVCTALGDTGMPCSAAADCASGTCSPDGTCAAGFCAPY